MEYADSVPAKLEKIKAGQKTRSQGMAVRIFVALVAAIFAAELVLMLFLHYVYAPQSTTALVLTDGFLLVLLLCPFLYFLVLRPVTTLLAERLRAEEALLQAWEELEVRIRERTAELAEANASLRLEVVERANAEEAVLSANRIFSDLLDASPLAIFCIDLNGNVTTWNKACERIFGWTEQEVFGQPNPIVPEDKQEEFRRFQERLYRGEKLSNIEVRRQRRDGSPIDVSLSSALLHDSRGEIAGAMAIFADVTENKRAEEERLRSYLIQAALGTILRIPLVDISLEDQLALILGQVISTPWLTLEPKGCIFLVGANPDVLEMAAHKGLAEAQTSTCKHVPFGLCFCGRAAKSGFPLT